jgi:large subunit ribosomal protein L25
MKSVSISGSLRENVGKRDAKEKRRDGLIPCVLYGGKDQKHFFVDVKQFIQLLYTPETLFVELNVDNKMYKAIVQETQFHPVTEQLLHVDFLEVIDDKPITVEIPMLTHGNSPGVMRGGKLSKCVRKLKVNGLLEDIPENITVDISGLDILDVVEIKDIAVSKIAIVDNPNKVVVTVLSSRNVEAAPTAE